MTSITLTEFESFQKTGVFLLDCRPTNDFASSFIPNSINASLNGSYEYMASCIFDKEKHLVVICEEGKEGESVLRLESEGFKDVSTFNFKIWKLWLQHKLLISKSKIFIGKIKNYKFGFTRFDYIDKKNLSEKILNV